jgi:hypothetical protein
MRDQERSRSKGEDASSTDAPRASGLDEARRRSRERLVAMWRHAVDHVVEGSAGATVQPCARPTPAANPAPPGAAVRRRPI